MDVRCSPDWLEYDALMNFRPLGARRIEPANARVERNVSDSLQRLYQSVLTARDRDPGLSRTSKLFRDGVQKMAKKLVEESIEVGLDAVQANREAVILESADLLYHLVVIWAECGVAPRDAFAEIERREKLYGIAEKLPKAVNAHPRRLSSLASRRKVLP
jgi:phosphoribosyl-ATP pyrophosphohydrolase